MESSCSAQKQQSSKLSACLHEGVAPPSFKYINSDCNNAISKLGVGIFVATQDNNFRSQAST